MANQQSATSMKPVKPKKCKNCGIEFIPQRALMQVCSIGCAIERATKQRKTKERKEYREAKEKQKSRGDWLRETQQVFNAYIRARDADKPCISSGIGNVHYVGGIPKQTSWDAGHYRTIGSCPELRFCELNVHKQSVHDNQHLHGNLIAYRKGLIERIGIEKVEWLESNHPPKHYSIEDLKQLKAEYQAKLKGLK